ncbi:TetR/AcrR family transcriptional regulator [Actinomadura sp. 9N407]|uniref:TetR/AcrR family transcriptional regulator n=1 Tax=Actinomadura sp. 9N407 TaxID=3375154 RepID=UPI0037894C74
MTEREAAGRHPVPAGGRENPPGPRQPGPREPGEREMGLRERKKLETRRRLSDLATGLFMTRGFDNVTIADVARAADVSVNTVFNYFGTKEDLFFDRQDEIVAQAVQALHDRPPGESAVALFHREFVEGLERNAYQTAFHEGSETWAKTVLDSPALTARQREIGRRAEEALAAGLAEETGAGPDDLGPRIAAAMIFSAQQVLVGEIVQRKLAGQTLQEMRSDVYAAVERVYGLLENGIGDYAVKPPAGGADESPDRDPAGEENRGGSAPAGK